MWKKDSHNWYLTMENSLQQITQKQLDISVGRGKWPFTSHTPLTSHNTAFTENGHGYTVKGKRIKGRGTFSTLG